MNRSKFIVTGTDTDVGKTIVSAMLVQALQAVYYKPVQAGLEDGTDTEVVRKLTQMPADHFLEEAYRLNTPASPHLSAQIDGIHIDYGRLTVLPAVTGPLIVEGAGGALVPITGKADELFIHLFQLWQLPVIVCARTTLGTINHSCLTAAALKQHRIPILGIIFVGDAHDSNESTICDIAGVKRLGRLPFLSQLGPNELQSAFEQNFDLNDFTQQDL